MVRFIHDLVTLSLRYTSIYFNVQYVGFTELDVCKALKYDLHYCYTVRKYSPNVRLLMTDTENSMF